MNAVETLARLAPDTAEDPPPGKPRPEVTWAEIAARAPEMVATMARYLEQLAVSARPGTTEATELALRQFAGRASEADAACVAARCVARHHVEDFKSWLAARTGRDDKPLSATTIRARLGMLRTFFERIIEWGYDDAPPRVPIYAGDLPKADEPLPKFLDDVAAAKFMAALAADPNQRRRLIVELLARTGMRVGELSALADDAVFSFKGTHWLRIPIGKLHNDRFVPLHPVLVDLIADYQARRGPSRSGHLVERDDGQPFDRRTLHRYVATIARRAGIAEVSPHQLRHTLATQAINRGMSLEALAALLGHRSLRMTLVYARISDRVVADEYFRVIAEIEQGYDQTSEQLEADARGLKAMPTGFEPSVEAADVDAADDDDCLDPTPRYIKILLHEQQRARSRHTKRLQLQLDDEP